MSDIVKIRPLRFLRVDGDGFYMHPITAYSGGGSVYAPAYGEQCYLTYDGHFRIVRRTRQCNETLRLRSFWCVEKTLPLSKDYQQAYETFQTAGFSHARFPTRRAAVNALEAVMETT